jgi:two-component system phosphate regulon sensor histidine kinase PhoR
MFVAVAVLSLAAATWYAARTLRDFDRQQTRRDLADRARLLTDDVARLLADNESGRMDELCKRWGEQAAMRVTVIRSDGRVVGDTIEAPIRMENHADRPEFIAAMQEGVGSAERPSSTAGEAYLYVAVAVRRGEQTLGVLRLSVPATVVDDAVRSFVLQIVIGGLAAAAAAAGLGYWLARRLARPLELLRTGAERFARGELTHKLPTSDTIEIATLAETLNQMAAALDERIRALVRQRNEADAVLASMVEGVIAVDSHERILSMNQVCRRLLALDPARAQGRALPEVVRNPQLQQLVGEVLGTGEPAREEIALQQPQPRFLDAQGSALRDAAGRQIGVLVVLHDVTQLRKLESVRRDFVANVSHELRTPITSIKGFVETLLDGALAQPDDARRFLEIVAVQTDRLGAIIEDLLMLSRIEQEAEKAEIALEPGRIRPVMDAAAAVCQIKAQEKQIRLEVDCDDALQATINPPLLEQALVNLIDNAVKYSAAGQTVRLAAEAADDEVQIHVRDCGCGIPREHLPRIFERFYRVDKARSRKLGGTGLGLAIVKHIAQSHGGRATVESALGQGSTFTLHLPARPPG